MHSKLTRLSQMTNREKKNKTKKQKQKQQANILKDALEL